MTATFASEGTNVFRTDGRYELVAECRSAAYAQLVRDGLNMISDECAPMQHPGGAHGDVVDGEVVDVQHERVWAHDGLEIQLFQVER